MERIAFREFMKDNIVQKMVILAQCLGLEIEKWQPDRNEKYPYRICFYTDDMMVGFIDSLTTNYGNLLLVSGKHPFTLYTPFGKVTGFYQNDNFNLEMPITDKKFDYLKGVIEVKKQALRKDERYSVVSSLTLFNRDKALLHTEFGKGASSYVFAIERYTKPYDKVLYDISDTVHIEHGCMEGHEFVKKIEASIDYNDIWQIEEPKCEVKVDDETYEVPIGYKKRIKASFLPTDLLYKQTDFQPLYDEIMSLDPDLFKIIEETRSDLTFLANGISPVCLYDILARCTFYDSPRHPVLDFASVGEASVKINEHPVLRRMKAKKEELK